MKRARTHFKLTDFHWIFLVAAITIIGSVMAFGMIAVYILEIEREHSLVMLCMIPPMMLVSFTATRVTLHFVRKKMDLLLDAIQDVADGNLDTRLPLENAEEYRIIYQTFNRMTEELQSTKREMENFTNKFSHEFKTPLTSIQGFSEYLIETGEEIESSERMEYLQLIADESRRLTGLAESTLLLSKVEACQILTGKETFSLSEQLKRCVILLLPQMEKKHISLDMDAGDLSYYGNIEWMEQIWLNLIGNAVKFTPDYGEIKIRAWRSGAALFVNVEDNGPGMDEETVKHVFEKYFQHKSARHAVRGNGIGLAVAHRIAELCEGEIQIASTPSEGSCFTVKLPVNIFET